MRRILAQVKEGTSHTQVRDESKVAQPEAVEDRTGSAERDLMEGQSMSQEAKEQRGEIFLT